MPDAASPKWTASPRLTSMPSSGSSAANRTAVAFAISSTLDQSAEAFRAGSRFVLERPLSFDSIRRTLHAAHGLILRERRRYFRCAISIPVSIQQEGSSPVYGETSDISEGGMAIRSLTPLKPGVDAKVQFTLPHTPAPIHAQAKIRWCEESGLAGLHFLSLSARDGSELQNWVAAEFERQLPPTEIGLSAPVSSPPQLIATTWAEVS